MYTIANLISLGEFEFFRFIVYAYCECYQFKQASWQNDISLLHNGNTGPVNGDNDNTFP